MKQIGQMVCHTLYKMNVIQTDVIEIRIRAERDPTGFVHCWMEGGTTYEQTVFLDAVQELMSPIENPRYLILRKSNWGLIQRFDFHAVPQIIVRNKESAEIFHNEWVRRIGKAELIYTRTLQGRKQLLKAGMRSMSSSFVPRAERLSAWR